jgi:hypothetical protein
LPSLWSQGTAVRCDEGDRNIVGYKQDEDVTNRDFSRRAVMRGALKAGAYSAPLIVSATFVREVAAVSPAPLSTGSVLFAPSSSGYIGQGIGAIPNTPFLFLLSDSDGNVLANKVVATDGTGRFTVSLSPSGYTIGTVAAPATVNGGNIFVDLVSTFGGMLPTRPAATPTGAPPTVIPFTAVAPTRSNCIPGQACNPAAIAQTAIALTATAKAKQP